MDRRARAEAGQSGLDGGDSFISLSGHREESKININSMGGGDGGDMTIDGFGMGSTMSVMSTMSTASDRSGVGGHAPNPRHEEGKYSDNKYLPNLPRATTPSLLDDGGAGTKTTTHEEFKVGGDSDVDDEDGGGRGSNENSNSSRGNSDSAMASAANESSRDGRDSRHHGSSFGVTSSAGAALHDAMGAVDMVDPMGMPTYAKNVAFPNLKSEGLTETHHGLGSNNRKQRRKNNGKFSVGTSFMPQGAKNAAKTALRFGSRFGGNFGIGGFGQKTSLGDDFNGRSSSKFNEGSRRNHSSSGRGGGGSSHGYGGGNSSSGGSGRQSYYKGTGYSSSSSSNNGSGNGPPTFSTRGQFSYSKASRSTQQYTSAYAQQSKGPPSSHGLRKGPPSSHGIRSDRGPPSSHGLRGPLSSHGNRGGPPSSHGLRSLGMGGPPRNGPPSSHGRIGPPSSHGGQLRLRTPNFDFTSPGYRPSQHSRRNNIGWAYR